VLDDERRPVHGLTASDFIVTENGVPQRVTTVTEIVVPPPDAYAAPWTREAGLDVITNTLETRRLVVIVMNDAGTGIANGEAPSAIATANRIIDQLGPNDLASVVHTLLGRMENFTTDRARLRTAANAFLPQGFGAGFEPGGLIACQSKPFRSCVADTLIRVGDVLRGGPIGRKMVFFISPPIGLRSLEVDQLSALAPMRTLFESLQTANATLYELDPRGLMVGATSQPDEIGLAESTGGRLVRWTNAPEEIVPEVFTEASSYYLVGYESTHTEPDRRFRRVRIEVNRPNTHIIARTGYFGPARPGTNAPRPVRASQEEQALARSLPSGDLPLRVTAAAFAGSNRRMAEVVAVVSLREPPGSLEQASARSTTRRVNLITAAFDTGWRQRGGQRQTIDLKIEPDADRESEYEVTTRLPLAPGRYELRVAAERLGRTGSVFVTLDVPDFNKDLVLSGLLVEPIPGRPWTGGSNVKDLLPVMPTTLRSFGASQRAAAFMRVYQGGSRQPRPVTVTATLRNTRDDVVSVGATVLVATAFSRDRTADYRFQLPTATLPPGEYLLNLDASTDQKRVGQSLRFSVREE
jgi:VWFA-related protein